LEQTIQQRYGCRRDLGKITKLIKILTYLADIRQGMETATLCKTKRGALLSYKENKFALFDPDLGVIDIHREPTAGDAKDGGVIEEG